MKYMRNKMQESTLAHIDFPSFIFKVNHVFMEEKDNPAEKVALDEVNGILILQNLPKTVFIN